MGYLVCIEGEGAGRTIPLLSHRTTFGRAADSDVMLSGKKSSRAHAQIVLTAGLVLLIDLGSANGTFVNGLPIRKTFLNGGDRIDLGDNSFVFYEGQPQIEIPSSAPPPFDFAAINQSEQPDETVTEMGATEDPGQVRAELEFTHAQLRALFTLSRELPRAGGPSEAIAVLAESLHLATGATRVLLWVREADLLPALPAYVETAGELGDALPVEKFPRAVLEWVEQHRRPLMLAPGVGPLAADSLPQYPLMALPVETESARLGILAIERIGRTDSFLKRDLDFALAACGYLALVLTELLERAAAAPATHALIGERFGNIIIGQSQAMRDLITETIRVAEADCSVLIRGESGTGKELIARSIHQLSRRSRGPFVAVNCGAIAPTLIESELFGHEKGAFTGAHARKAGQFEMADGGTIFLDEISELPPDSQVKFLRVLQEGEFYRVGGNRPVRVNVRVIAATNRNLEKMITEGLFREDLYFRLNVVELAIPPLRERREDIGPLAEFFFHELRRQIPTTMERISPHVMTALSQYQWPGNVRQLRNAIEHALVMGTGKLLGLNHLPDYVTTPLTIEAKRETLDVTPPPSDLDELTLDGVERKHILSVLQLCDGNKQRAAQLLGISRSTLYEKMRSYGLE